ncbi:hypothetical protein JT079_07720 [Helicobacter pylori]|nr:hypothetical protein [Helicobacter pylori]
MSCVINPTPTKPHKRSVSKLDKSASQFESVGVSRSCFCVSKIKQDSANLALG